MSKKNSLNISFEDYFKLLMDLLIDDLKIQRHFHFLSLSGFDSIPLKLKTHETLFRLIGFKNEGLTPDLEDWYFKQAERVFSIDVVNDNKALLELSSEILTGLNKFRIQSIDKNKFAS